MEMTINFTEWLQLIRKELILGLVHRLSTIKPEYLDDPKNKTEIANQIIGYLRGFSSKHHDDAKSFDQHSDVIIIDEIIFEALKNQAVSSMVNSCFFSYDEGNVYLKCTTGDPIVEVKFNDAWDFNEGDGLTFNSKLEFVNMALPC